VLNPWNIDALEEYQNDTGHKVYNILQTRLHPAIRELREKILSGPKDKIYDINLTYITSRGNWYHFSWKGNIEKSGGVATNIGVHFFDMLTWIFGDVKENITHVSKPDKASGYLELKRARVRWFLSIDYNDLPESVKKSGKRTYRCLEVDQKEIEFSDGFGELHTETYREILAGRGFGLAEAKNSIELVYDIRNSIPIGCKGNYHPMCKNIVL
jgi:UDP-N-acetyl-2-amino-2-deoxyglucuronate dehydrogenase